MITEENGRLRGIIAQWEKDLEETQRSRMDEKRTWTDVESQFVSSLEEKDALIHNIQGKLDEARGEIALLKKKHEVAIKVRVLHHYSSFLWPSGPKFHRVNGS